MRGDGLDRGCRCRRAIDLGRILRVPSFVQFVDELGRLDAGQDLGFRTVLTEEADERVLRAETLDQPLAPADAIGEAALAGGAKNETAQPIGKIAADEQQAAFLQGPDELLRRLAAAGDDVVASSRRSSS